MAKRKKRNRGGGVPFNPDVDTGTKRPVTARVAVGDVNDKFSDYPSNGLTPRRLARIFREADEGNVSAQMELFEEMEEKDTHLFSQMQTRKLAVTGLDWEVQPFSEDEIDKEIADFIDEQLKGIENFDEVLIDMLDAIGKGISIMELAWTVGNEVHVGAVLRNGETFARSGSKKTYIDQEGQRKRRVKLWDRSTSLHVVIADTSEEKVEEILENFLQNLKKGIDVDGNWVNIVVGEADWVEEGDSILKAKVAVQFDITFEGGIYQDRDIKPMDIGSVG